MSTDPSLIFKNYSYVIRCTFENEKVLNEFKNGDKVRIWFDYIRESEPPKTSVFKLEILK